MNGTSGQWISWGEAGAKKVCQYKHGTARDESIVESSIDNSADVQPLKTRPEGSRRHLEKRIASEINVPQLSQISHHIYETVISLLKYTRVKSVSKKRNGLKGC